jgi:heat shock protein HslJ
VEIFTGCNTGGGEYSVSGLEITLSGIAYTEEGCADADLTATERHIQDVLKDGTVAFEIDAAQLTVMNGSLGIMANTD